MKKLAIILAMTLVFAVGCKKDDTAEENSLIDSNTPQTEQAQTEENEDVTEEETSEQTPEETDEETLELNLEDVLQDALSSKNAVDIQSSDADIDEITLEPEHEGWEERVVREYLIDDEIIKLTVTEPTDSGQMSGLTTYYYDEGELFFVEAPFANYAFKDGRLVLWTDEDYEILNMSDSDLKRREEVLVSYLVSYLEMFGLGDK